MTILSLAIVSRNACTVAGNILNIWITVKGSGYIDHAETSSAVHLCISHVTYGIHHT